MEVSTETEFQHFASSVSSGLVGNLSDSEKLILYGLYTVARKGSAPAEGPSALFDPRGYAKWEAWKSQSHLESHAAMIKYVEKVKSLDAVPGRKSAVKSDAMGKEPSSGFDIAPSEGQEEGEDDLCYWAAIGDLPAVLHSLQDNKESPNYRDADNLTPLIRAADRDRLQCVDILVQAGANVNAVDSDGQSALHYAVCCEHVEMAALLVHYGASTDIRDAEGMSPMDNATPDITGAIEKVRSGTWTRQSEPFQKRSGFSTFVSKRIVTNMLLSAGVILIVALIIQYLRHT